MKQKHSLVLFIILSLVTPVLQAGPLTEATVTKIINDVKLVDPAAGAHAAKLDDVVKGDLGLRTGIKSRSELLFQDNTLTRIGPESYFSFQPGTRDLTLDRGTLLLQVPKGIGGARIHTAAITASITGTTIMMEHIPGRSLKVLVLEGSLRLSVNGRIGDSVLLLPGKMVIMPPNAKRIPDPVTVDLRKVVTTSSLVNMHGKKGVAETLPSAQLIDHEIQQQDANKGKNNLAETNLVIMGKGTSTLIASDDLMDSLARHADGDAADHPTPPPLPMATPTPAATPNPTPNPAPTPNPNPPPVGPPPVPPPVGYITDGSTVVNTVSSGPNVTTTGVPFPGVIYTNLNTNGSPSAFLFGSTSAFDNEVDFDTQFLNNLQTTAVFDFFSLTLGGLSFNTANGPNSVALVGDNGITNSPATTIDLGGINSLLLASEAGNVVLDSGISFLTTHGENPKFLEIDARAGDALIGATFNLPQSSLQVIAENNANFGGTAAVTAQNLNVTGLQSVHFDGTGTIGQTFQLNGGAVELGGAVTANSGFIYGSSASIGGSFSGQQFVGNVTGDFTLTNTGALTDTGAGNPMTITAGGNMTLDGAVAGQQVSLTATNGLEIGGSLTASNAFTANAATATFNGILNVQTADVETTGDFVLNAGGSLTSANAVTIHSSGGSITLDAGVTGHSVTLTAAGNVAINQAVVPSQLVVTGGSISFGTDQSVSSPGNELTSTNGNIDATGHALSGFDQVSVTNGDFLAGSLHANNLVVTGPGNINVANDLVLAKPLSAPNSLTVGGLLSDPTITDGTATINALQTNSLTSSGAFTLVSTGLSSFSGNTVTITAPTITFTAGAILDGTPGTPSAGPGNASNLTISTGAFTLAAPLSLNGGDAAPSGNNGGANGGNLNLTSSGAITLNAPITATTGQNSLTTTSGGAGGTVNLTASDTITLNDKIEVSSNSGQRVSHAGGNIKVTSSKNNGVAISVTSSGQLLALLNAAGGPGGSIKFVSSGPHSAVNVNGATMEADNGTVLVQNTGANGTVDISNATLQGGNGNSLVEVDSSGPNGTVDLTNATIHANVLKASALGPNGTLNVGGGVLDANSVIHLYAVGSNGSVNFVDNVTLSGSSVKTIAGDAVTIFNGKIVTVLGPAAANVFTNHANYTGFGGNSSTTGTFGGQGAVTKPLSQAPGY